MKESDLRKWLKEECNITSPKELQFFSVYMQNGFKAGKAYQTVYNNPNIASCGTLASRILRKVQFPDLLDFMGHGIASMGEALDSLKSTDPDKYLNHIEKLAGYNTSKTEISGPNGGPIQVESAELEAFKSQLMEDNEQE